MTPPGSADGRGDPARLFFDRSVTGWKIAHYIDENRAMLRTDADFASLCGCWIRELTRIASSTSASKRKRSTAATLLKQYSPGVSISPPVWHQRRRIRWTCQMACEPSGSCTQPTAISMSGFVRPDAGLTGSMGDFRVVQAQGRLLRPRGSNADPVSAALIHPVVKKHRVEKSY